jgi:hypothetical protein
MTASTRPDMTLEQIINRQIDYADEVATRRDLLSLYAEALSAETPGSKRWTFALFTLWFRALNESAYEADHVFGLRRLPLGRSAGPVLRLLRRPLPALDEVTEQKERPGGIRRAVLCFT